jgi:hypothetical protein
MNKAELPKTVERFRTAKMLDSTADYTSKLDNAAPVDYFKLPRRADAHGRVVVAFAHLLGSGHLDPASPKAYGVILEPLAEDDPRYTNDAAMKITREHHVIAEDLALRHGIFTPYGRLTAEVAVINGLMPAKPRAEFAAARIAQLGGLLASIEADNSMTQHSQDRAATELHRAQTYLTQNF